LEPELACEICSQVADALDAAHERGLVHRDVKPSNVLLDERRHVYLADFGLTRRIVGGDAPGVEAGSLGTIDYIAPEQLRGEEVDGRADLYSLGCLLYECLTGEPPFRRPSDLAVAFAHLEDEPAAPQELEGLVKRALAKAPEDRYQSGGELVSAARTALGLDGPRHPRWPLLVAAVALALVAAGSLSFLLTRGGSTGTAFNGRLLRIDPQSNRVTETVDIGQDPSAVAFGAKRVWVSTKSSLWRVDPKTSAGGPFASFTQPLGVAVDGNLVFVPEADQAGAHVSVTTLGGGSGKGLRAIRTGGGGPITSSGPVWFAEELVDKGKALRLGVSNFTGKVVSTAPIPDPTPPDELHARLGFTGIAADAHSVWAAGDALDRRVFRIDPRTSKIVAAIDLPFAPGGIAVGEDGVWVTGPDRDVVARIDPATNRLRKTIPVGREPTGVAVGGGSVWVANTLDRSISRIDPRTDHVVPIPLKVSPRSVTVADGAVWVAASAG
jgi:DNA-binding beta-propeller fold protein YncE